MSQYLLPELDAMQQIASIVSCLTPAERKRVAAWLMEYAPQADAPTTPDSTLEENGANAEIDLPVDAHTQPEEARQKDFVTFAELYERVAPKKGAQKAAVAGYWLQTRQGQQSWKASEVNKLLKTIDVRVSSVSIVLTNAVKAKDALIVELARLGDGERSRKTFCLSERGMAYVEGSLV